MHAALKPVCECALAPSASMHLRLHDEIIGPEFARNLLRLLGRARDPAARGRRAELLQQLLRLIFVDVHAYGALVSRAISAKIGQKKAPPSGGMRRGNPVFATPLVSVRDERLFSLGADAFSLTNYFLTISAFSNIVIPPLLAILPFRV